MANEPDTSREGDKWLDWKRAVEEVDETRAVQRLPVQGQTAASKTVLSELLSPLKHLRPAEVPLALLLRNEG